MNLSLPAQSAVLWLHIFIHIQRIPGPLQTGISVKNMNTREDKITIDEAIDILQDLISGADEDRARDTRITTVIDLLRKMIDREEGLTEDERLLDHYNTMTHDHD